MSLRSNKWLKLALLAGVAGGGYWAYDEYLRPVGKLDRLSNQVWIERMPRDERDMVHHLLLVEGDRGRIGAAGRTSRWRVRVDLLRWATSEVDGKLALRFEQEKKRVTFHARTWRCAGEAPAPFELCLALERNGKKTVLYSKNDWVVRPREAAAAGLEWVSPALDAVGRIPTEPTGTVDDSVEASPDWSPFDAQ